MEPTGSPGCLRAEAAESCFSGAGAADAATGFGAGGGAVVSSATTQAPSRPRIEVTATMTRGDGRTGNPPQLHTTPGQRGTAIWTPGRRSGTPPQGAERDSFVSGRARLFEPHAAQEVPHSINGRRALGGRLWSAA